MRWPAAIALAACLSACAPEPDFSREAIERAPIAAALPRGFLLGAGTSAHQIEGGQDDDWTAWEAGYFPDGKPHVKGHRPSGRATDSWNRWPEDFAELEALGANAYRMSIEWSRLEPAEGQWDEPSAARYRAMFASLRARGITPMVTIYHFTLPRWFEAHGGWEWDGAVSAVAAFARRAGAAFGDLVDDWLTINEPSAITLAGYGAGRWPPGVADAGRAVRVYATLIRAHAAIASALRSADTRDADGDGRATRIGIAHHVTVMQAASSSSLDEALAASADDLCNEVVPRALRTGRIQIDVPGVPAVDEAVDGLVGSLDYLGINYYRRDYLRFDLGSAGLVQRFVPEGHDESDMQWEVYVEGFYRVLLRFTRYGWPIYVTENGVADATDRLRPFYLRAHLYAMERAIDAGADIRGYFHWSLLDNFEWGEGVSARFGLFAVDFDDPRLPRHPRASAAIFREAARALRR